MLRFTLKITFRISAGMSYSVSNYAGNRYCIDVNLNSDLILEYYIILPFIYEASGTTNLSIISKYYLVYFKIYQQPTTLLNLIYKKSIKKCTTSTKILNSAEWLLWQRDMWLSPGNCLISLYSIWFTFINQIIDQFVIGSNSLNYWVKLLSTRILYYGA